MRLTRPSWRSLPVVLRGLIVAMLVVIAAGVAMGWLLSRFGHRLEGLDDVSTWAAHAVWVLAVMAFAIVVFRRR